MITVDTNVLVRYVMADDPDQAEVARDVIDGADRIVVPIMVICELVWVLRRAYHLSALEIESALRGLAQASNVELDQAAMTKGLALMAAGGDFADAIIAFDGRWRGGDELVTFDRRAARLLPQIGLPARCLMD